MSDAGLIGVDARMQQLTEGRENLLGYAPASETDQGVYFVVVRSWPHPSIDDGTVVSIRYAYLTRGEGSDGWVDNGVNMRVEGDAKEFMQQFARLFSASIPRLDGGMDPATEDLRPAGE